MTNISEGLSIPNKSYSQKEKLATECEKFGEKFPVLFNANLTRKMHCLSIVLPHYIRTNKYLYKTQKLEQSGERLHKQFNDYEWNFRNHLDLPKKSFLKIRHYERCQSSDKICYPTFSRK